MFLFSMVQDGPRGIHVRHEPVNDVVDDPATYGVDWEAADDPQLMAHLLEHNPQQRDETNPFQAAPLTLSDVPCEAPGCPFSAEDVLLLQTKLAEHRQLDLSSQNMQMRRLVWVIALDTCKDIWHMRTVD